MRKLNKKQALVQIMVYSSSALFSVAMINYIITSILSWSV